MASSSATLLLPPRPQIEHSWTPSAYTQPAKPPPQDERAQSAFQAETAFRAANSDGFNNHRDHSNGPKKLRARRTIDYFGEFAKWSTVRKIRPNPHYTPYSRPDPEFIIDLLPPAAYSGNSSTSLCEKFVHSSVNKIRSPVNVVKWTPEGRRVLTGAQSGEFTLWNGLAFNFETILQAHDTPIRAVAWSHSSRYLLSSEDSGQIKYFQSNMNNLAALPGHAGHSCRGLAFAAGDEKFVSAGDDGYIRIWAFEERRQERGWRGHGQDVRCVDWHPTKGLIVSGSTDDKVSFWDPRSGQALASYLHKNSVLACQWNPNGNLVATASRDTSVRVFDIRTFKELEVFQGHKKDVASLAWHPIHHDLLASGDFGGTILQWTLSHPQPRVTIENAHDSQVWSLDWHPLGHCLASGSNDYTTRFWCRSRPADEDPSNGQAAGYGGGGGLGGGAYNRVLASEAAAEKVKRMAEEARAKIAAAKLEQHEVFSLPGLSSSGHNSAYPPLPSTFPPGFNQMNTGEPESLPGFGAPSGDALSAGGGRREIDYSIGGTSWSQQQQQRQKPAGFPQAHNQGRQQGFNNFSGGNNIGGNNYANQPPPPQSTTGGSGGFGTAKGGFEQTFNPNYRPNNNPNLGVNNNGANQGYPPGPGFNPNSNPNNPLAGGGAGGMLPYGGNRKPGPGPGQNQNQNQASGTGMGMNAGWDSSTNNGPNNAFNNAPNSTLNNGSNFNNNFNNNNNRRGGPNGLGNGNGAGFGTRGRGQRGRGRGRGNWGGGE
ncbi:Polyadenylation factor I complex, subunit PFS2 [Phaffia rhodozyma]|uniref:Polyadenylation factor subunit 2 n=1 Tax=Phaffia rhodozyma TaxID=264483 RepID=A0A0F7SK32_PHARH|nr:Polyadenylation factor I complex, subunit PFS2 [Phaffia rhodozyma]